MAGLSSSNLKPLFISLKIASTIEKNPTAIRSSWDIIWAIRSDIKGYIVDNVTGKQLDYDISLLINVNPKVLNIDEFTIFCLDNIPTENFKNGDYQLQRLGQIENGIIPIYLNKIKFTTPELFFQYDTNTIASYQCNYDNSILTAYINKDIIIPFNESSVIWYRRPENNLQTLNQIKLISIELVHFNQFNKLTFEVV